MRPLLGSLLLAIALWAQPQPQIVVDPHHPEQDTLDFGATLVGIPLVRPLYLINPSADTLSIPAPLQPFFSIERTPDQSSDVYDFVEFAPQDTFPILVPPRQTRLLFLRFEAIREFYPLGEKRAALHLSVRYARDTASPAVERTLVLRGIKAEIALELAPPTVSADSVFLGAERCVQGQLRIALKPPIVGGIDTTFPVRSRIRFRSLPEREEFRWDTLSRLPARAGEVPLQFCYRPLDAGPDTAIVEFLYRRYPEAPEEQSTAIAITGFGVFHRWEWEPEELGPGVRLLGDTIDFGAVRLGNLATARVRVRNAGNYRFHATDTLYSFTPEADGAFRATPSPFPDSGLAPGREGELVLTFEPRSAGLASAAYQLRSDLGRRVWGVLPEARQWTLFLRGVGIGPRLQLLPSALETRFLWSPRCPRSTTHTVILQNSGTDVLQIDSLRFRSGAALSLPGISLPLLLYPGEQQQLQLRVAPPSAGTFLDTLVIHTNIPSTPWSVLPVRVIALSPTDVTLYLPELLRAKPGSTVWIPIAADSVPADARRCRLVLSYDGSILRWYGLRTEGTALEGAQVQAQEEQPGMLVVEARQPHDGLLPRALLLEVGFRVFLGKRPSTELALQGVQLGDSLCPDFWGISVRNGRLALDSVCGLEAKLLPEGAFRLEVTSNPVVEELVGSYEIPGDGELELALFNTAGMQLRTLFRGQQRAGRHSFQASVQGLPAGMYLCLLRFGGAVLVRPLIVQR